jgi:hypothetical protein
MSGEAIVVTESEEVDATTNPVAETAVLVAVDQCKTCGCLWRLYSDNMYSLVPGMTCQPCCDNVRMDTWRVYPRSAGSLSDQELAMLVRGL